MKFELLIQPLAQIDLIEQFSYLSKNGGFSVADHYVKTVRKICDNLLENPYQGALYKSEIKRLYGMRFLPVSGFKKFIIFYLPKQKHVLITRILHSARDIETIIDNKDSD